jgi:hypothetical protein
VSALTARSRILPLTLAALLLWSVSAAGVCEADCARRPAGLAAAGAEHQGPLPAAPSSDCHHASSPRDTRGDPAPGLHAAGSSHPSDGELACCCAAGDDGALLAPAPSTARDAAFESITAATRLAPERLAAPRGTPIPPVWTRADARHPQRNQPLLI